jgi:hypothetical protein
MYRELKVDFPTVHRCTENSMKTFLQYTEVQRHSYSTQMYRNQCRHSTVQRCTETNVDIPTVHRCTETNVDIPTVQRYTENSM